MTGLVRNGRSEISIIEKGNLSEELKTIEFGNKLLNKLMTKYPKLINYMNDKKENDMVNNDNKLIYQIFYISYMK